MKVLLKSNRTHNESLDLNSCVLDDLSSSPLYADVNMFFSIHRVTVWLAFDVTHPVFWTVAGSLVKIPFTGIWAWVSWASLQMTGHANARTVGHYIFHLADQESKHRAVERHKHEGVTEEHWRSGIRCQVPSCLEANSSTLGFQEKALEPHSKYSFSSSNHSDTCNLFYLLKPFPLANMIVRVT